LRGEWGFNGVVVSDYYAITELYRRDGAISHGVAEDKAGAALIAAEAGVNMELPDPDCYPNLLQLVQSGDLDEGALDRLLAPLLALKFRVGLFEDPYVDVDAAYHERKLDRDRELALRAAHETIVLLKNDRSLLPLDPKSRHTIAVMGPNAHRQLLGGYSGIPRYYTTVLEGIREKVGGHANVTYAEGCQITRGGSWQQDTVTPSDPQEDRRGIAHAVETALQADLVVLALGENEQTSREAWSKTHLGDRASLDLIGAQNDLLRAVLDTGKPVIVLLFNGRPNAIASLSEHVPAILECWYLGQETGRAVADVLFGECNPSGKLPISLPRSVGHIPCHYSHKPSGRRGYLFDDVTALYPFGYGMSYTSFELSNVRLERTTIRASESTRVLVDVRNTGSRAGQEVVQLYIHDVFSSATRPVRELKGFEKIRLEPHATVTVALPIGPEQLAFTNKNMEWVVEPGEFEVMVGNSSRPEDLTTVLLTVA
jgi:beta-glucosidase